MVLCIVMPCTEPTDGSSPRSGHAATQPNPNLTLLPQLAWFFGSVNVFVPQSYPIKFAASAGMLRMHPNARSCLQQRLIFESKGA